MSPPIIPADPDAEDAPDDRDADRNRDDWLADQVPPHYDD